MKGIVGQFFRQFGITISAAVLISLFVAFTLDPMLSSRFSKRTIAHGANEPFARAQAARSSAFFEGMDDVYRARARLGGAPQARRRRCSRSAARRSWAAIGKLMGNEFVNAEDRGQFVVDIELPAGTSLDETDRVSRGRREASSSTTSRSSSSSPRIGPERRGQQGRRGASSPSPKSERTATLLASSRTSRASAVARDRCRTRRSTSPIPPFVEGAQTEAPIMIDVARQLDYDDARAARRSRSARSLRTHARRAGRAGEVHARAARAARRGRSRRAPPTQGLAVAQVAMALRTAMEGDEAASCARARTRSRSACASRKSDRADAATMLAHLTLWTPKGPVDARRRRARSSAARGRR